jgi:3-hydroxypropanoate dehydrogenase
MTGVMRRIVTDETLDILFRTAGDRHVWRPRPVSDTILRAIWELVRLGPSSGACGALRIVFVKSEAARARLAAALTEPDCATLVAAPVAAIVACPAENAADVATLRETMLREGALHAAYLMLAGRALGLDCAPIWEFDAALVDRAFFPDGSSTANFLCALGYAEDGQAAPSDARAGFAEACAIV